MSFEILDPIFSLIRSGQHSVLDRENTMSALAFIMAAACIYTATQSERYTKARTKNYSSADWRKIRQEVQDRRRFATAAAIYPLDAITNSFIGGGAVKALTKEFRRWAILHAENQGEHAFMAPSNHSNLMIFAKTIAQGNPNGFRAWCTATGFIKAEFFGRNDRLTWLGPKPIKLAYRKRFGEVMPENIWLDRVKFHQ
jgi:hypothetical protein